MNADDPIPILLVDDDPAGLLAEAAALAQPGHRIVQASSGEEALRRVLAGDFAVILLDVHMPGMDGIETARLLRARERSRHTPIIFLTATDEQLLRVAQGYGAGAVDYIAKPLQSSEIIRAKVRVFANLYRQAQILERQAAAIAASKNELEAEAERRRVVEDALRRSEAELELRVRERTAEVSRLLDEAQNSRATLLALLDHQRRTEAALRESTRKLNSTINSLPGFVYRCANHPDWPMEFISEGVLDVFGYPAEDFISGKRMPGSIIAPMDRDRVWSEIQAALESRRRYTLEWRAVHANGEERWVWERGAGVFDGDTLLALEGFVTDITEHKEAEDQLQQSHAQLRALAGRLQAVREEERTRIAREIHDVLAQELTRIKIDLSWLKKRLADADKPIARPVMLEKITETMALTDSSIRAVQGIATDLRPAVLDNLGLAAAIEWQAKDFQNRTDIQCTFAPPEIELALAHDAATGLFRIVQESLTNVARHAQATHVVITLESAADQLILTVRDDGVGLVEGQFKDPHSLGLTGMRERALLLGGTAEIAGTPGEGTIVRIVVPMGKD